MLRMQAIERYRSGVELLVLYRLGLLRQRHIAHSVPYVLLRRCGKVLV